MKRPWMLRDVYSGIRGILARKMAALMAATNYAVTLVEMQFQPSKPDAQNDTRVFRES